MKLRSSATSNRHLRGSGERNGEQRYKHDAGIGAATVSKKAHLGTKQR